MPQSAEPVNKAIRYFSLMIFFFAIADGISAYFFPVLALQTGLSYSAMGLLYSSSSVFGLVFDVLLSKYLKNTDYRRLYVYALILVIAFPIMIVSTSLLSVYVVAAAVWALYSNLNGFGYYDFTAVEERKANHAKAFASLSISKTLGYAVAPLIAVYVTIQLFDIRTFFLPVFAGIIALVFMMLTISSSSQRGKECKANEHPQRSFKEEFRVLMLVGMRLWPILLLHVNLSIMEAAFWTVSPIIENLSAGLKGMGGFILFLSMIPSLMVGWSISPLTKAFGKKAVAFYTFLFSNLLLLTIGFISNAYVILLMIFLVNVLQSITYPAVYAAMADYLKESTSYDNEIVAVNDMSMNMGYIIGPAFAGIAMQFLGDLRIFSVIAIIGIICSFIVIAFSKKNISFYDRDVD